MTTADSPRHQFWCTVFVAIAGFVIVVGAGMIVPPRPSVAYFNVILYGTVPYPDTIGPEGVGYLTTTYAVLGAVMISWMAPMIYLAHGPLRRGDRVAWNVLCLTLVLWFVIDSSASVLVGAWQNAASNVVFAALFALPLAKTRKVCSAAMTDT